MSTLVLVSPAVRADGGGDRFSVGHLRELSDRFDRVVMVADHGPGVDEPEVDLTTTPAAIVRASSPLASMLQSIDATDDGPCAAVIIDGDIRTVRRAGAVARAHAVPVLWWCDGPPADEVQRDTLNFIDAVLAPVDETSVGRYLTIGAGIDLRTLPALPLPPRPPLRVLVLGRAVNQGGLAVPLRALAEARARGVDVHLVIVDSLRVSTRSARNTAESLVADLMLSHSVELLDTDRPVSLRDVLRHVHAVIDAGADTEVDREVLEAMACARPVLSSRPAFTPMLADEPLPLVFATGDASSLAACLTAVADARHEQLIDVGDRLRTRVERHHSLDQWGASVAAVVDALQARRSTVGQ